MTCNLSQGVLQKGMQKGSIITLKTLLNKSLSTEQIADLLDMDISYVKHVEELLKEYPDKSEKELVELL